MESDQKRSEQGQRLQEDPQRTEQRLLELRLEVPDRENPDDREYGGDVVEADPGLDRLDPHFQIVVSPQRDCTPGLLDFGGYLWSAAYYDLDDTGARGPAYGRR